MPFESLAALTLGLLLFATGAEASLSSIRAHNVTFSPGDTISVFVDSGANKPPSQSRRVQTHLAF